LFLRHFILHEIKSVVAFGKSGRDHKGCARRVFAGGGAGGVVKTVCRRSGHGDRLFVCDVPGAVIRAACHKSGCRGSISRVKTSGRDIDHFDAGDKHLRRSRECRFIAQPIGPVIPDELHIVRGERPGACAGKLDPASFPVRRHHDLRGTAQRAAVKPRRIGPGGLECGVMPGDSAVRGIFREKPYCVIIRRIAPGIFPGNVEFHLHGTRGGVLAREQSLRDSKIIREGRNDQQEKAQKKRTEGYPCF